MAVLCRPGPAERESGRLATGGAAALKRVNGAGEGKRLDDIRSKVRELVEPAVEGCGCELVDVEYVGQAGRGGGTLRLLMDKPGGVTLDDCTGVSREVSAILDVEDVMPGAYTLEVSSPGLDRPLVREKDFVNAIGRKVRIKTRAPVEGRKNFKGTVEDVGGGTVTIRDPEGRPWRLPLSGIDRARLEIVF